MHASGVPDCDGGHIPAAEDPILVAWVLHMYAMEVVLAHFLPPKPLLPWYEGVLHESMYRVNSGCFSDKREAWLNLVKHMS